MKKVITIAAIILGVVTAMKAQGTLCVKFEGTDIAYFKFTDNYEKATISFTGDVYETKATLLSIEDGCAHFILTFPSKTNIILTKCEDGSVAMTDGEDLFEGQTVSWVKN